MNELMEVMEAEGEQEQRKRKGSAMSERIRQDHEDMLAVARSREGRRFLARILADTCYYHGAAFILDARAAAFADGRRVVGAEIRRLVADADSRLWLAIEADILARKIELKDKPKGQEE